MNIRLILQGLILGAGNIPIRRTDIINEIKAAVDRGCLVLNVSQCMKGHVTVDYAPGKVRIEIFRQIQLKIYRFLANQEPFRDLI
jgi:hypothetical protein